MFFKSLLAIFFSILFFSQGHAVESQPITCSELLAGSRFLNERFLDLHRSKHVEKRYEQLKKRSTPIPNEPEYKIAAWLKFIEGVSPNRLKVKYYDKHVIKADQVPQSYYDHQVRLAREQGVPLELTEQPKQELAHMVVQNQRHSLEAWVNYLTDHDAHYPSWAKYWVLSEVIKLGSVQYKESSDGTPIITGFNKRSPKTVAPFAELNREALAQVIDGVVKKAKNEPLSGFHFAFRAVLEKSNRFDELYASALEVYKVRQGAFKTNKGEWVKYNQGSNATALVDSLNGKNTGWCTAGFATAQLQLQGGDFYVYYSLDEQGRATVPRIAIRMQHNEIAEIRGVSPSQHLDAQIADTDILNQKLSEFGDKAKKYFKRSEQMHKLTQIENKHNNHLELTPDELKFLYEIDEKIEGFGYGKDPRINEIIEARNNMRADIAQALSIRPEQVTANKNEVLAGESVYHTQGLDLQEYKSLGGIKLPRYVRGVLELSRLGSAAGIVFPKYVESSLRLDALTIIDGATLPHSIGRHLFLSSVTSAEGITFPQSVGGAIVFSRLTSARNVIFPQTVGEDLDLGDLQFIENVTFPQSVGWDFFLNHLKSAKDVILPKTVAGTLNLELLESAEGVTLPEHVGGYLILASLKTAKGLKLPKSVGGNIYLNKLTPQDGVVLPENLGGRVYYKND